MTKKMSNIIAKYTEKLESAFFLFKTLETYDIKKLRKETYDLEVEFEKMITSMMHYDLISDKDFGEAFDAVIINNLRTKYIDRAYDYIVNEA